MRCDSHVAVRRRDRLGPGGRMIAQVLGGDRRPDGGQPASLPLREIAVVELVEPDFGEPLEGRRQSREADAFARAPGPPEWAIDLLETRPGAELFDDRRERSLDRRDEAVPGRKPSVSQL